MPRVEVTVTEPRAPSPNSGSTPCGTASVGEITSFSKKREANTEYSSMLSFKKVLFPVDFSSGCVQTAAYVAGIAAKFDSHVTLFQAVEAYDPFGYGAGSSTQLYGTSMPIVWQQRESALAAFGDQALVGVKVDRVIRDGEAADTILRYVREHGIDLIIMPTHAYTGFRRLLLGSVARKVLHHAHCPVWTTAHCERLNSMSGQRITRMVCGLDLNSGSVDMVRSACELAERYGAEVRLVHAVTSMQGRLGSHRRCRIRPISDGWGDRRARSCPEGCSYAIGYLDQTRQGG